MGRACLSVIVLALAVAGVGCPCVNSVVNTSPEVRWWLFSNYGAQRICPEMTKRGMPLKLQALGEASVGRYFPASCDVRVDDANRIIVVSTTGTGYATLPLTRRVGFYVGVSVAYRPDFRMESDATWIWGRFDRLVAAPDLRILGVENPVVSLATRTPAGDVATVLGQSIVSGELGKGFTVVHADDGDDFALGHLEPPERPKRQFQAGADHVVLASDLTQVNAASRDYLGPFEVGSNGAALYVRAKVTGAPVAFALVDRTLAEAWRRNYESAAPLGPPPGPLVTQGILAPGDWNLKYPLPRGSYAFVVENQASPPIAPLGVPLPLPEAVAWVSYSAELGGN